MPDKTTPPDNQLRARSVLWGVTPDGAPVFYTLEEITGLWRAWMRRQRARLQATGAGAVLERNPAATVDVGAAA